MAAHSNQWATGPGAQMAPMPQQQQGDGYGPQTRPMGCEQRTRLYLSAREEDANLYVRPQ